MKIRGTGGGSKGSREATVILESPVGPSLRFAWRQPLGQGPNWQLSGEGFGTIFETILPGASAGLGDPSLSFRVSEVPGNGKEGEIHFEAIPVAGDHDDSILGVGTVCFGGGGVSIEECTLVGRGTEIELRADISTVSGEPPGRCIVSGVWRGEPLRIEGTVALVAADGVRFALDTLSRSGTDSGPGDLRILWRAERPGRPDTGFELKVEGSLQVGGGTVRLKKGRVGLGEVDLTLESDGVSLSDLSIWLPFSLPGVWSGLVRGEGEMRMREQVWRGTGGFEIDDGRVGDLPVLREILATLPGPIGRSTLRFDSLRSQWRFNAGDLLVEQLRIAGREVTLEGPVYYAQTADSVAGLLRVRPVADRPVGQLLRLLGEPGAGIDVALSGTADLMGVYPR